MFSTVVEREGPVEALRERSGAGTRSGPWTPEMGRGQSSNMKVSEWPPCDYTTCVTE